MNKIMSQVKMFLNDEEGASAVEYGVLVALIIAVCVAVIASVGGKVNNAFSKVNTSLANAGA
ncbi:MAG: Flp/Fap pilin component [Rhodocyclaceae bacterium]|nr:Flp/Fap pilin component [Rhodocyclaceae bacterium]